MISAARRAVSVVHDDLRTLIGASADAMDSQSQLTNGELGKNDT